MALNLHHLAVFEAVAGHGNVTAAAATLMISQPAVSKQIKLLEKALGTRLMERGRRGILLTEAGRVLAAYAGKISALSEQAESAVADLQSLRRGSLTVAASPTIGTYLLPQVLVRYRLKYPGIRLKVEIEQSAALYRRFHDNDQIDVGLTEVEPNGDQYTFHVFMRDEYQVIVPPGHALARRRSANIEEFVAAGLILRDSDSPGGSFAEQALRQAGLRVAPFLRLNSTEAIKEAVAAGLGVAIVSGLAVRSDMALKRLAVVPLRGLTLRRPLYRVTRPSKPQSKAATAFLYMLKHAARGSLPGLDRKISPAV
jgi:DNA-binding transcriptional LysR family regulator